MNQPNGKRQEPLYGEQQIAAAELEAVPNPARERDYLIACASPEFTCLCPRSGFPDFATIRLRYVPDRSIVELKSLKLYLNRYRDEHAFHEAVVNQIADDLAAAIDPRWLELVGDFNVRGNVKTVITVVRQQEGYRLPDYLRDQLFSTLREPSGPTL
ncbi:MAG TPA: preQ(1) synthase [Chloroflexota bacterium]